MKLIVDTAEDFAQLERRLLEEPEFGIDYETTSSHPSSNAPLQLDKLKLAGVGFGFLNGDCCYVPVNHIDKRVPMEWVRQLLQKILGMPKKIVWAHNMKFEIMVTHVLRVIDACQWRCSMLAQYLLGKSLDKGRGLKLKPAVKEFLKHEMVELDSLLLGRRMHDVPAEEAGKYCADDALQCLRLGKLFEPQLEQLGVAKAFIDMECRFTPVLVHMYECGFALDRELLGQVSTDLKREIDAVSHVFLEMAGCPISSNSQVSKRMFEDLKWWPTPEWLPRGKSGYYSIAENVRTSIGQLLDRGSPGWTVMELKNRFQKISKLESTYTRSLIACADAYLDGRVRAGFHQAGTATGRLSSSGPNLQNIPRKGEGVVIRDAFIADEGWCICLADYSQADLVMLAHLSQDPMLMKAYIEGIDIHQQTSDNCACDRDTGKVVNLGLIYEMREKTLAANLGISVPRAGVIWNAWHTLYSGVRRFHKRMHAFAKEHGYVRTITGRVRFIKNIKSKNFGQRSYAEREATNTPVQGSVSDVIKIAMRNLFEEWRERGVLYDWYTGEGKAKILSQVHDEIICEFRNDFAEEGARDVRRHMEKAVELRVPMTAGPGIGETWLKAKEDSRRREKIEKEARKAAMP